jgi:putative hydrolase of the HAD superfamily
VLKWQAIIFDLDDTLYPEREYVLSGFRHVATYAESLLSIDRKAGFLELQELFRSGVRGNTFNLWLKRHNIEDQNIISLCIKVYKDHIPNISLFKESTEVLCNLKKEFKLGLVTDGYAEVQKNKIQALDLEKYFDAIVISDEFGREAWKPSTKPFEIVLRKLNCAPRETVYVGDNCIKDFIAPRSLQMGSVRIKRPGGEYSNVESPSANHNADITIGSLSELPDALDLLDRSAMLNQL